MSRSGHLLAVGVAAGGNHVGTPLEQGATSGLDDALAAFSENLGDADTTLTSAHEGLDLVEFARAEIAGFRVRVDDRVGDDAHAVLPRNKRPP
jgi:hypothetical protein